MKTTRLLIKLAIAAALIFVPGCKTGEMKDQISSLTANQLKLAGQRDSLIKLVMQKSSEIDMKTSEISTLATGNKELETKNKSLQSGYYNRGEQLKKANTANEELNNSLTAQSAKNDSLKNEINSLLDKIAAIDSRMAEARRENNSLAEEMRQKEEKRIADSIAEANRPKPVVVRESGFINITEVGGAFGLGNTDPDFSRSIISLDNVFGYDINKHFMAGLGTGVNIYNGGTMVPLFIDMRYTFNDKKMSPFITADGGVLINISDIQSTGLFINPQFGLRRKISDKLSLNISTGFYLQEAPSGMRNTFINLKGGVGFAGKR